jgi:hypothetical protein
MKIFNVENGKEKVYVQMNDMGYLNSTDIPVLASIYLKVFDKPTFISDDNRMEFISFDDPSEVEYFKGLDFILDYGSYKKLSLDELETKGQELLKQQREKAEKFNELSDEGKRENEHLIQECENLDYMISYVQEFYWLKNGQKTMSFPQVPSSNGFKLAGDDDFMYEISEGLDPNIFYLYRKDGEPMTDDDRIPPGFYQMGISLAIMEKENENFAIGDYSYSTKLSEDKTKLIISFTFQKYEEAKEEGKEMLSSKRGIKEFVKSIFKKEPKQ